MKEQIDKLNKEIEELSVLKEAFTAMNNCCKDTNNIKTNVSENGTFLYCKVCFKEWK